MTDTAVATTVYRLFDADDGLLYVGVTRDPTQRFKEHSKRGWWGRVARTDLAVYPDRPTALAVERQAIVGEAPIHNRVGRVWPDRGSGVLSIKTFPRDLHRAAKAEAARRDEPLTELIIRAMRNEVARLKAEEQASR